MNFPVAEAELVEEFRQVKRPGVLGISCTFCFASTSVLRRSRKEEEGVQ
jgi:hypothetical protein